MGDDWNILGDDGQLAEDGRETREEMADRLVRGGGRYADQVRGIMDVFDVSDSTAKRDIAQARSRAKV